VDAWHRAERGEAVDERHRAFESWIILAEHLDTAGSDLRADYDSINTRIVIGAQSAAAAPTVVPLV
jgi:hypothetical protein